MTIERKRFFPEIVHSLRNDGAENQRRDDDTPLERIEMGARALNALQTLGFETIGQVRATTAEGLRDIGVRPRALNEIRKMMHEAGEALREAVEEPPKR